MIKKRKTNLAKILVLAILLTSCMQNRTTKPVPSSHSQQPTVTIAKDLLSKLPTPTSGFKWHVYEEIVFQVPKGWNEQEKSSFSGGIPTETYAASPEEFSEAKMFEMGLTIQVISGPNQIKSIPATDIAKAYIKPFINSTSKEDVLLANINSRGNDEILIFRYRDAPPIMIPIIVHKFIIANNLKDVVYILTFESPEQTWQENWNKYGEPFLQKVTFSSAL